MKSKSLENFYSMDSFKNDHKNQKFY